MALMKIPPLVTHQLSGAVVILRIIEGLTFIVRLFLKANCGLSGSL
jgi:hypothetical protein